MSPAVAEGMRQLNRIRLIRGMMASDRNPLHHHLYKGALDDAQGILDRVTEREEAPHAKVARLTALRSALMRRHAQAVAQDDDETAWHVSDAYVTVEEELADAREEASEIGEWA